MKFVRHKSGLSLLDHRIKEDILEKFKVDSVENKLAQHKQKWLNRVRRMEDIRYPQQLPDYRCVGRRPGRLLRKLLDGYNREAETGHLLT